MRPPFGPTQERDACGIGFVADSSGRASREVVDALLEGLYNVRHRGATAADRRTGDGAGVLLPSSGRVAPGVAMVFLRDEAAREAIERACREEGLEPLEWREVAVDTDALGDEALASMPRIEQLLLRRPAGDAELRAFRARRRAERTPGAYISSLSFRTVTYKALCAADELARFYPDLRDPALAVPFGIFHQRFSTNTTPSWERAQPFRLLCHNGEINAIQGNVNWMRAREGNFGSEDDELLHPAVDETGSDSAMLDNALELLVRGGRDVRHALTMLVPEAWEGNPELDPELRDYYRYHALLVEPWDGPAGLVFTDGHVVGAALDRNGLRPLRYAVCADGLVVCCSEAGAVDLSGRGQVRRGRLGPGQIVAVDPERGFEENAVVKERLARRRPYGSWLAAGLRRGTNGVPVEPPAGDLTSRQAVFGYTREDLNVMLRPVAAHGHEPTSSMGDDTALPPLAGRARPLYSYFNQRQHFLECRLAGQRDVVHRVQRLEAGIADSRSDEAALLEDAHRRGNAGPASDIELRPATPRHRARRGQHDPLGVLRGAGQPLQVVESIGLLAGRLGEELRREHLPEGGVVLALIRPAPAWPSP